MQARKKQIRDEITTLLKEALRPEAVEREMAAKEVKRLTELLILAKLKPGTPQEQIDEYERKLQKAQEVHSLKVEVEKAKAEIRKRKIIDQYKFDIKQNEEEEEKKKFKEAPIA